MSQPLESLCGPTPWPSLSASATGYFTILSRCWGQRKSLVCAEVCGGGDGGTEEHVGDEVPKKRSNVPIEISKASSTRWTNLYERSDSASW